MKELASFISQLLLNDDIFLPEEEINFSTAFYSFQALGSPHDLYDAFHSLTLLADADKRDQLNCRFKKFLRYWILHPLYQPPPQDCSIHCFGGLSADTNAIAHWGKSQIFVWEPLENKDILVQTFTKIQYVWQISEALTAIEWSQYYSALTPSCIYDISSGHSPMIDAWNRWSCNLRKLVIYQSVNAVDAAGKDFERCTSTIHFFIKLAEAFLLQNNFSGLVAVIKGLNSVPVIGLRKGWEALPLYILDTFHRLTRLTSPADNYAACKTWLRQASGPTIPFLEPLLSDLAEDMQTLVTDGGNVNMGRCLAAGRIVSLLLSFQKCSYGFTVSRCVADFLTSLFILPMEHVKDEELLDASFNVKSTDEESVYAALISSITMEDQSILKAKIAELKPPSDVQSMCRMLHAIGLQQYTENFLVHQIDRKTFLGMDKGDFVSVGCGAHLPALVLAQEATADSVKAMKGLSVCEWSCQDVASWLVSSGEEQFLSNFININGRKLRHLTGAALFSIGIARLSDRKRILRKIIRLSNSKSANLKLTLSDCPADSRRFALETRGNSAPSLHLPGVTSTVSADERGAPNSLLARVAHTTSNAEARAGRHFNARALRPGPPAAEDDDNHAFGRNAIVQASLSINDLLYPLPIPLSCNLFQLRRLILRRSTNLNAHQPDRIPRLYLLKDNEALPLREDVMLRSTLRAANPPLFTILYDPEPRPNNRPLQN